MISEKTDVAIIGSGNIGCDLLVKIQKSKYLECILFSGQREESPGIAFAKTLKVPTSIKSIEGILESKAAIVFDATTASAHKRHAQSLKDRFVIDMTPSKVGLFCIPTLNLQEALGEKNINLISCGAQAAIPLIKGIMEVHPEIKYIELVGTIASKSAGIGTRDNIDEYVQTTQEAIEKFTKVKKAKVILVVNPAEPPLIMHNTIYAQIKGANIRKLTRKLKGIEAQIQVYVPGYHLKGKPTQLDDRLIVMNEVTGSGDYLPKYAGNLDVITSGAIKIAEEYAKRISADN